MKEILAFGDSLTWGAHPETGGRHPFEARWPSVLAEGLGGRARVIAEGLGGRTTSFDDHAAPCERNAVRTLPLLLGSHYPLDLVIIMLGTNDLKPFLGGFAAGAQMGMKRLVQLVRGYPWANGATVPQILVVAPPPCGPSHAGPPAQNRSIAESERFAPLYRALAEEMGTGFFDAGTVARPSMADGVHLEQADTIAIGRALIPVVEGMLWPDHLYDN